MNEAWQRIKIKPLSSGGQRASYWARFQAHEDGYQLELSDLQQVWRSVCETEELVQRHVKYNPQLEIDLEQLPTILRDQFFAKSEKEFKMRYRVRAEGGLELRCLSQIAYCEFRWIFRCDLLPPDEASLFLKQYLIEPLLCAIGYLQEHETSEDSQEIASHELTSDVNFHATTAHVMAQYIRHHGPRDTLASDVPDGDDTATLTSSFMDGAFSQLDRTASMMAPSSAVGNSSDNEPLPDEEEVDQSPALAESDEEMARRAKLEEKITRQKRKRERGESKTRKKRKIQLV